MQGLIGVSWILSLVAFQTGIQLTKAQCQPDDIANCLVALQKNQNYIGIEKSNKDMCLKDIDVAITDCKGDTSECTPANLDDFQRKENQTRGMVCRVCELNTANDCINQQTGLYNDATDSECSGALNKITDTVTCVEEYIEGCSEQDKTDTTNKLREKQDEINTKCGDKSRFTCSQLGYKYPAFQKCAPRVENTVNAIITSWNGNSFSTDSTICSNLGNTVTCLDNNARDCKYLKDELLRDLYTDPKTRHLKQALEVCGGEVQLYPSLPACTESVLRDRRKDILENCAIDPSVYDVTAVAEICVAMQRQIDCILQRASSCPEAADEFLRPRVESYALMNEKFCANITIAGVELKSTDSSCNYDNIYGCFGTNFMFSIIGSRDFNQENIKTFYRLNALTDKNTCSAFRYTNFTQASMCETFATENCQFALPITPTLYMPSLVMFDKDLYENLDMGPVGTNEYGAWFLSYKGDFLCYDGCDDYESLKDDLTPCLTDTEEAAEDVNELPANSNMDAECEDLQAQTDCIANITSTCPIFIRKAEATLNMASVGTAVSRCNLTVEVYPDNYGPTRPPITVSPPTTTVFTFRTTKRRSWASTEPVTFRTTTRDPGSTTVISTSGGAILAQSLLLTLCAVALAWCW